MLIRKLENRAEFIAGDGTILREMLRSEDVNNAIHYSFAHARLHPEQASVKHRLRANEVYYILAGKGIVQIDGERQEVGPGDCIYIPPLAIQHIENTGLGDLVFLCIVDPAWSKDDEEVI